ncbi:MAG: NAD(P)(+) transhydrogenase (Re/Si-specific) subunit beta [SAR324 cluster bacterium]|nr:NAD(P)(+) transhydrogenase (Re/Si-specific) subunit beta [SAR324 cluster bacterium]
MSQIINFSYLIAAVLFIVGLKNLSSPKTAPRGNMLGAIGMLIAVVVTLLDKGVVSYGWIFIAVIVGSGIGAYMAKTVQMTNMPQMVAIFNGFGGGASLLVAGAAYLEMSQVFNQGGEVPGLQWDIALILSALIGAVTLTGSVVAFGKLQGIVDEQAVAIPKLFIKSLGIALGICALLVIADPFDMGLFFLLVIVGSLVLGVLLVMPIGGADMPVVIALLNSYSGLAAAATGFVLHNNGLIIGGSLVGASGLILTNIMCKAMNRSLANVLFGGAIVSDTDKAAIPGKEFYEGKVKQADPEEVAMILENAQSVVFVPGYGLAVAQAQHANQELGKLLQERNIQVRHAIHPVAGRMPGHMNVLLAEAEVPYEQMVEMDAINPDFSRTDVVIILGANDVVNPAARDDPKSPIYGMPILDVDQAKTVFIVKRSLSPGFAGIPNQLFINENSLMVFGDAKDVLQKMIQAIKEL